MAWVSLQLPGKGTTQEPWEDSLPHLRPVVRLEPAPSSGLGNQVVPPSSILLVGGTGSRYGAASARTWLGTNVLADNGASRYGAASARTGGRLGEADTYPVRSGCGADINSAQGLHSGLSYHAAAVGPCGRLHRGGDRFPPGIRVERVAHHKIRGRLNLVNIIINKDPSTPTTFGLCLGS